MATIGTTNGMQVSDLSAAPSLPGYSLELGNQVDQWYGGNVASAANLPAAGKFLGQRVWLVDVKGWGVWDGSKWVTDTAPANLTPNAGWTLGIYGLKYARRSGIGFLALHLERASFTAGTATCTLPTGFRPAQPFPFVAKAGSAAVSGVIGTDGIVTTGDAGSTGFFGSVNFPLAP